MIQTIDLFNTLSVVFLVVAIGFFIAAVVIFVREGIFDYYKLIRKNAGKRKNKKHKKQTLPGADPQKDHATLLNKNVKDVISKNDKKDNIAEENEKEKVPVPNEVEKEPIKTEAENGSGRTEDLEKDIAIANTEFDNNDLSETLTGVLNDGHDPTEALKKKASFTKNATTKENEALWAEPLEDVSLIDVQNIVIVHC